MKMWGLDLAVRLCSMEVHTESNFTLKAALSVK